MKTFLLRVLLFSLPVLAGLGWLLWRDVPVQRGYHSIMRDCRTGDWIYHRLYERSTPLDVAFVGTSRTMCGVNDSVVEYRLRQRGVALNVASLGVSTRGPNLHALVAEHALRQKHPRLLIVEVGATVDGESHRNFGEMATWAQLTEAPLRPAWAADLYKGAWARVIAAREQALRIHRVWEGIDTAQVHAFQVVGKDLIAPEADMQKAREKFGSLPPEPPGTLLYDLETGASRACYRRIGDMCRAQGTQLVFLYLPTFGTNLNLPQEHAMFSEMGPIWVPPDSIRHNPAFYFDIHHYNQVGARKMAAWLADQIAATPQY